MARIGTAYLDTDNLFPKMEFQLVSGEKLKLPVGMGLCRSSFSIDPDLVDLAYFSFTTMTALGMGDITPARHTIFVRFLVVSEVLIGLYFWAVLVGMIIGWTVREVKSETNLPK